MILMSQEEEFFGSLQVQPVPQRPSLDEAIASLQATTDNLVATNAWFSEVAAQHQAIFYPPAASPPPVVQGQAMAAIAPPATSTTPPAAKAKTWSYWLLGGSASVVFGVFLALGGALQSNGGTGASANFKMIFTGVIMILMPLLAGAIWMIVMITKDTLAAHARWLAQHTPEQQAQIRKAERAALWAGTAVAAVALHEHNKHTREATIAAAQANRADYATQRRHRELIDAIQGQQPLAVDEQTAATQRMLAQSAANRNNRGWS
jgi:Na+-transporting methylmalonyl-CoA/oxaloacetate decarboxylase gamma subunit